jgi:hypothetical protein
MLMLKSIAKSMQDFLCPLSRLGSSFTTVHQNVAQDQLSIAAMQLTNG